MRRFAVGVLLVLGIGHNGACGNGPCEELDAQLRACPRYQEDTAPVDCSGEAVNDQAECILQSGADVCSDDGLAVANAACRK